MNILLIMADQFAAHALDRRRDTDAHFRTPHLDRLAAHSTRFTQAYTPFPLCVPARSAMVTGRYPHELGIMSNHGPAGPDIGPEPGHGPESLGHWFAAHGWDCAYAGKWHARQASATARDGFTPIHPFGDEGLVEACTQWLAGRDVGRPYLLVASFDDPHTICEYARGQPMPYGDVAAVPVMDAPPLPTNFTAAPHAPSALATERGFAARVYGSNAFTPDDWRHYRHAYAALVERVDRRVGQLLDGIDLARTAVVFVSDHGDGDASHGWNQKTALFQECIRVPFLVHVRAGTLPWWMTPFRPCWGCCPPCARWPGSPRRLAWPRARRCSRATGPWWWQTVFSDAAALPGAGTPGRALLLGQWKYTVYGWGDHREQLHDLSKDPGEQRNLAVERDHAPRLEAMRAELLRWCLAAGDTGFLKKLVLPASASAAQRREIFAIPY